jgi:ABC-2 type transport system ATP-binding protein
MSEAAITIDNLTKTYGDKAAVDNLSLSIEKGVCCGFLGPNGAGKSTTVNILAGVLTPTSGSVFFNGVRANGPGGKLRSTIGLVPENFLLFDHLSVWEHFLMLGPVYGLTMKETTSRAEELLEYLHLAADRQVLAGEISYGMKKKLCLGLALLHNPSIYLLDEPFEGLDPLAAEEVQSLVRLLRKKGKTVFLCSHLLSLVGELVDEVAIIAGGRLVFRESGAHLRDTNLDLKKVFMEKAFPTTLSVADLTWLS